MKETQETNQARGRQWKDKLLARRKAREGKTFGIFVALVARPLFDSAQDIRKGSCLNSINRGVSFVREQGEHPDNPGNLRILGLGHVAVYSAGFMRVQAYAR